MPPVAVTQSIVSRVTTLITQGIQGPSGAAAILAGDVTGALSANIVGKINGATVPVAGSLTAGQVLQVSAGAALIYAALNLANAASVTGVLPVSNLPNLAGDVTGSITASVVGKLQGNAVASGALGAGQDGYALTWVNSTSKWTAVAIPAGGITQLTGDVTAGPGAGSVAATVAKVNGATVPAAGALTTGNVLQVTGASALGYAAVNLAGGANCVTGVLPVANHPNLAGDVTGAINATTVVQLTGSTGTVTVTANGIQWASTVTGPALTQASTAVASAIGQPLTIRAQNATGTTSTGGDVTIYGGTGTSTNGSIKFFTGGSGRVTVSDASTQIFNSLKIGITPLWTFSASSPATLVADASAASVTHSQNDVTTASATGAVTTLQAQNATGTTSTGGALDLRSGTGTTAAGNITIRTGSTTQITVSPTLNAFVNPIAIGATVATTGALRLANANGIYVRNPGNTADRAIVFANSSDGLVVGDAGYTAAVSIVGGSHVLIDNTANVNAQIFLNSGNGQVIVGGAKMYLTSSAQLVQFATNCTTATLAQEDVTTASATGNQLAVHAQNATGTTSTGGNLVLASGTGTTAAGIVSIQCGATDRFRVETSGVSMFGGAGDYGGGSKVAYFVDGTAPTSAPGGGFGMWSDSKRPAFKFGPSGDKLLIDSIVSGAIGGSQDLKLKVIENGNIRFIPLYTT